MAIGEIKTFEHIQALLTHLEKPEFDRAANPMETLDNAMQLSAALSQSWEYAGDDAADYTMKAMQSAGQSDGRASPPFPDSSQSVPTPLEDRLISSYEGWCRDIYEAFGRLGFVMQGRLQRLKTVIGQMDEARKRDSANTSTNFYSAEITENSPREDNVPNVRDKIEGFYEGFLEKRNLFRTFREAHGLRRNPKYEASILAFLFIATICIVVETAVNGFMYGQASELGLIGGWGVAAGLSIVIFSSSFMAGWILTLKNGMTQLEPPAQDKDDAESRRQPTWTRSFVSPLNGWGGWAVLSVLILMLIAFVCVYRDEAATFDPSTDAHPMAEAIVRLTTLDLLPRADIEGLLLIFVNLAIMIIAMYKGYTHFDTVPHYKAHAEELARARQQFKNAIDIAQADLGIAERRFENRLQLYAEADLDDLVHRYGDGADALKQLHESRDIQITNTARECNERLRSYRTANESARPGPDVSPPPPYFTEYWKPPPAPQLNHKVDPLDEIDTSVIADCLEQHRSAALQILSKRAQDLYIQEISRWVRESEVYRYEINQKEA